MTEYINFSLPDLVSILNQGTTCLLVLKFLLYFIGPFRHSGPPVDLLAIQALLRLRKA